MSEHTNCDRCGDPFSMYAKTYPGGLGIPGYCHVGESPKREKICYKCAAVNEQEHMNAHGKTALYLILPPVRSAIGRIEGKVQNWTGHLSFDTTCVKEGKHYIPGVGWTNRYDCWFVGKDGFMWHGTQYGSMTQIVHCKRTKQSVKKAA